jgi:hypothetical protein
MCGTDSNWRNSIRRRFSDRIDIGKDALYTQYFMKDDLSRTEVLECLELIESEYELPAGLLRPEDSLLKIFEPVPAKNLWQWLVYQVREGDSQSELNYELEKRMLKHGTINDWHKFETVDDLVRAWCGKKPK